jgi:hypothetical protein
MMVVGLQLGIHLDLQPSNGVLEGAGKLKAHAGPPVKFLQPQRIL